MILGADLVCHCFSQPIDRSVNSLLDGARTQYYNVSCPISPGVEVSKNVQNDGRRFKTTSRRHEKRMCILGLGVLDRRKTNAHTCRSRTPKPRTHTRLPHQHDVTSKRRPSFYRIRPQQTTRVDRARWRYLFYSCMFKAGPQL